MALCLAGVAALAALAGPAASQQQVAEVQVNPPTISLTLGQEGSFFATAYDGNGNVLVGRQFRWTSSNPNVVRVEADAASSDVAKLIAVSVGIAQVQARVGSVTGSAAVQVVGEGGAGPGPGVTPAAATGDATHLQIEPQNVLMLPGESRQLIAVFQKEDGSPAAPTQITWRSLNAAIARVSEEGSVVAISEGQGLIEATSQRGLIARAPLQVAGAEFAFATPVLGLSPGVEATIQVIVPSQNSRILPNGELSWRSTNPEIARVTPLGVVTAVAAGQADIAVSGFLQERSLRVSVHRPVRTLTARPTPREPVAAPLGGQVQFVVRALDENDEPVPEAPLLWRVADTSIATFDAESQVLSGKAIGSTELHVEGPSSPDFVMEGTWQINVIAGGLLADPRRVGIGVDDTVTVAVSFTDEEGIPIGPATSLTWTSTDPAVATVDENGMVTGVAFGPAQVIAATPWDRADTVDVYVQGNLLLASTRGTSTDLVAIDHRDVSAVNRVTANPAIEISGAFSPDGSQIAFVSNRDGNFEIYVSNADGSDPRRITSTAAQEDAPSWTPDGRRLVYVSQTAGEKAQIWIRNADGSDPQQLTSGEGTNFEPAISPDGETIAFISTRDANYDVYRMRLDGSAQENVTGTPGQERHPAWFPDGRLGYIAEGSGGAGGITGTVMRRDMTTGESTAVSPSGLAVTDFAISGDASVIALEVSSLDATGVTRRIVLLRPGDAAAPLEIPRMGSDEQHSRPAFRPTRTN